MGKGVVTLSVVSLVELAMSYRKAKVDLFYSTHKRRLELVDYEANLAENLRRLRDRIVGDDEDWAADPAFVGGFTFAPKRIDEPKNDRKSFWSVPTESWRRSTNDGSPAPAAEFRLMSRCSIDLHVFSTLWMLRVGSFLDSRLKENAMGSRLRHGRTGGPNFLGSGSFKHYPSQYKRWLDGGLNVMSAELTAGKKLIALTADVSSFYHQLDPVFIIDQTYQSEVLGVRLDADQQKLTRLFVAALHAWSAGVASRTGWRDRGLPVGLPASAVVANLALAELDSVIVENIEPLYYGRYVDDVLLVIEDPGSVADQRSLWNWVIGRSRNLLTVQAPAVDSEDAGGGDRDAVYFSPTYLRRSVIAFENKKNKTFHLRGRSGHAVIESIRTTMRERSSEWRLLANVPSEVDKIETAISSVRRSDGDEAATLRDADQVSARKQMFAVRLRDFESFERNLEPNEWAPQRQEFIRVACEQMISLPSFFDLATYFPRLVELAASCADAQALRMLFEAIARLPGEISETCRVTVSAFFAGSRANLADGLMSTQMSALVLEAWTGQLVDQAAESLVSAWRNRISSADLREVLAPLRQIAAQSGRELPGVGRLTAQHRTMVGRDLANRPYRWSVLGLPNADKVKPLERDPLPLDRSLKRGLIC